MSQCCGMFQNIFSYSRDLRSRIVIRNSFTDKIGVSRYQKGDSVQKLPIPRLLIIHLKKVGPTFFKIT